MWPVDAASVSSVGIRLGRVSPVSSARPVTFSDSTVPDTTKLQRSTARFPSNPHFDCLRMENWFQRLRLFGTIWGSPFTSFPIYQNPLQAETEIASESVADKTFTIQLSRAHVSNHLPVNVFFMNRYSETTPAGTQFRIRPHSTRLWISLIVWMTTWKNKRQSKTDWNFFRREYCVSV